MKDRIKRILCDWTHGGGDVKRDSFGRINWQCRKCGRWSDDPVTLEEERKLIDAALRERRGEQK